MGHEVESGIGEMRLKKFKNDRRKTDFVSYLRNPIYAKSYLWFMLVCTQHVQIANQTLLINQLPTRTLGSTTA